MLRTILSAAGYAAALMLHVAAAHATLFTGSYTVSSNTNPSTGLAVATINDFGSFVNPTTNSFTGLNVPTGTAHFTDLFEIFALESPPYTGNDLVPQPITVTFNFTNPSVLSEMISGTTVGILNDDAFFALDQPDRSVFPHRKTYDQSVRCGFR